MNLHQVHAHRRAFLSSKGLDPEDATLWGVKWVQLKPDMSFESYIDLALEAGITEPGMIGCGAGQYQMGRYGDKGDYRVGNCRFITKEQNTSERLDNGGYVRGAIKIAEKLSKQFCVVSPSGVVHEGLNLSAFCREHGLTLSNMSNVCNGKTEHHKQWRGRYQ